MKKKMLFIFAAASMVFLLVSPAIAADAAVTKTIKVSSREDVPQTITENGAEYTLKDVRLDSAEQNIGSTVSKAVSVTRTFSNLVDQGGVFPRSEYVETEDGYSGTLYQESVVYELDQGNTVFDRNTVVNQDVDHGYMYETPDPEPYIEQDYYDAATNYLARIRLPYIDTTIDDSEWYPARHYMLEYAADQDGRYYLPETKEIVTITGDVPGTEFSDDVLWLLGLEGGHYRVVGAEWEGEPLATGQELRRTAKYMVEELGQKYVSHYGCTLDLPLIPRYTAAVTYTGTVNMPVWEIAPGTEGTFLATAKYELMEIADAGIPASAGGIASDWELSNVDTPAATVARNTILPAAAAGTAATGSGMVLLAFWRRSRNVMVMQYNKAAEQYVLLGRKRVILTEPLHVNVTRHADGLKDIYVQLRRELIRKAGDRDITIICGKREIRANKYMENGIALTKIS